MRSSASSGGGERERDVVWLQRPEVDTASPSSHGRLLLTFLRFLVVQFVVTEEVSVEFLLDRDANALRSTFERLNDPDSPWPKRPQEARTPIRTHFPSPTHKSTDSHPEFTQVSMLLEVLRSLLAITQPEWVEPLLVAAQQPTSCMQEYRACAHILRGLGLQ
eukprot:gnl/Spiro4/28469_TR14065_c0_g1_i1.p1 gnl/Spiro4/28469_TR14065_c0_g1~~gnl/Spiro4/28469_TR14065_c0_g1_i1.p1  ORF type:complete len:162 (-),score=17.60 gnl/Spiro4/28469_TR14065_c0_g1_i1:4-489(-)